ncbi:MAG: hypothetical protein GY850_25635 [bacterium]|nr:hypothetical protein [bacterium]
MPQLNSCGPELASYIFCAHDARLFFTRSRSTEISWLCSQSHAEAFAINKVKPRQQVHKSLSLRIAVNYCLSALSKDEVEHYIIFRLARAGRREILFRPKAIERIYQASGGIARTINLPSDAALVYGFGYNLNIMDETVIEQVVKDKRDIWFLSEAVAEEKESTAVAGGREVRNSEIYERLLSVESEVHDLRMKMKWAEAKIIQSSTHANSGRSVNLKALSGSEKESQKDTELKQRKLRNELNSIREDFQDPEELLKKRSVRKVLTKWFDRVKKCVH